MKVTLENVTLLGIDCVNVERLTDAMDLSEKGISFAHSKLLTSLPSRDPRLVQIPRIGTIKQYSDFCISELYKYVETDYVLIVQYDGFILNPARWNTSFLDYDYIGAPWLVHDWSIKKFGFPESLRGTRIVGNGGFCIRSKKFLEVSARLFAEGKIQRTDPEDVALCFWYKELCEKEGIVFAPPHIATQFSIEGEEDTYTDQFGFHGFAWTNIDAWIDAHPEHTEIIKRYRMARGKKEK